MCGERSISCGVGSGFGVGVRGHVSGLVRGTGELGDYKSTEYTSKTNNFSDIQHEISEANLQPHSFRKDTININICCRCLLKSGYSYRQSDGRLGFCLFAIFLDRYLSTTIVFKRVSAG